MESESQLEQVGKMQNNQSKDVSIDYKEIFDNFYNNSSSKQQPLSFVSFVMEPSKKNQKSMKIKDKTKPLVDIYIINKQIRFMNKLVEIQKQNQGHYGGEFDEIKTSDTNNNKRNKKGSSDDTSKIIRGNLGFCYLDMSLLNLCGLPSLWIDQKSLANGFSKTLVEDTEVAEPYYKPFQKNLMKKQYKIYQLLRFHKIFENDKVYGKTNFNQMNQYFSQLFQDYWSFSIENLKDGTYTKYQLQQQKMIHDRNMRNFALHIIQGSQECINIDIPRPQEVEGAYFKLINSEAKILKQILTTQGFQQTDLNDWNFLWTSVTLQQKPQIYEQLHDFQKINHFMNSVELTRKDRFAENIQNMKVKFGLNAFDFVPETYYYPDDFSSFTQRFNQIKAKIKKQKEDNERVEDRDDNFWIYKPSQSSQGKGIFIISETNEIPRETEKGVICKYVNNPLLINGHKFDLRVYVLVTSVDPLRIYVYNEGLARFASFPYDNSKNQIKNLYSHLTNYSINKKSDNFTQNKSLDERDHGNKWSISDLQNHLEKLGIHMQPIWERIYDAVIKAIISVEHHLFSGQKKIQSSTRPQNCFELFGFDILLDSNFKPYILEVNFSPSLSADTPLDYHIKSNLLVDTLNIVGIKKCIRKRGSKTFVYPRTKNSSGNNNAFLQLIQQHHRNKEQTRLNNNQKVEQNSFPYFLQSGNLDNYFLERLSRISAKHREIVFETLDEFQRNKNMNYTCIFPTAGCYQYDKFFEGGGRASNQLLHKYLFTKNDLYTITKQITEYQKQFGLSKQDDENSQSDENEEKVDDHSDKEQEDSKPQAQAPSEVKQEQQQTQVQQQVTIVEEPSNEDVKQEQQSVPQPESKKMEERQQMLEQVKFDLKLNLTPQNGQIKVIRDTSEPSYSPDCKITNHDNTFEPESPKKAAVTTVAPPLNQLSSPFLKIVDLKEKDNNSKMSDSSSPVKIQQKQTKKVESPLEKNALNLHKYQDNPIQEPLSAQPQVKVQQAVQEEKLAVLEPKKANTVVHEANEKKKDLKPSESVLTDSVKITPFKESIKTPASETPIAIIQNNQTTMIKDFEQGNHQLKTEGAEKTIEERSQTGKPSSEQQDRQPQEAEDSKEGETPEKKKQKMIITGDDILIEYVHRITKHLESVCVVFAKKYNQKIERVDEILPQSLRNTLEKFTMHTIWSTKLNQQQKLAPLNQKIKIRHKEMVDRRTKILTTMIKKNNKQVTPEEIKEELKTQDANREKIISRIQSQKIEKMVKQSNAENQIDIVSILVEGHYNLPVFLQIQGGKTVIHGTLSSIKMFEKILRSDKVQNFQNKMMNKEPEIMQGSQSPDKTNQQPREFLTETQPTRENSKMFMQNLNPQPVKDGLIANFYVANKNLQSASKADASMNQTLNQVLTDASKRRMMNSGSASGYKNINVPNGLIVSVDKNKFNGAPQTVNSYMQIGSGETDEINQDQLKYHSISEGPKPKISRQVVAVHQKNSQSFMNQQQNFKGGQTSKETVEDVNGKQVQSFDKRQRSYRNDNQIIQMSNNKINNGDFQLEDSIRITNASSNIVTGRFQQQQNSLSKGLAPDYNFNRNEVKTQEDMVFNQNQLMKNAFSPNSQGANPKVSNSVISTMKTQDAANQSFVEIQFEFNRSHQGESFSRKIQSIKKTDNIDLHQQLQAQSVIQNTSIQRIQHETKRGSSHSHHTGQGTRSNFKNNTSNYDNQPILLHNNNGVNFESSNMIKQTQVQNNNRLMSFDSQQTGNRQIGGTINVQPAVSLSKQMQIKSYNGQSKQQLNNQGLTLPQIANPSLQIEHKKSMLLQVAQNSNKDLNKIKNKQHI